MRANHRRPASVENELRYWLKIRHCELQKSPQKQNKALLQVCGRHIRALRAEQAVFIDTSVYTVQDAPRPLPLPGWTLPVFLLLLFGEALLIYRLYISRN